MEHCRKGHVRTPENTYVNPSSGRRYCRACSGKKRRKSSTGSTYTPRRANTGPMTQRQLDALRDLAKCLGCGARPQGLVGEPAVTEHAPGCRVYAAEVVEQESAAVKGRVAAWATRKSRTQRTDAA